MTTPSNSNKSVASQTTSFFANAPATPSASNNRFDASRRQLQHSNSNSSTTSNTTQVFARKGQVLRKQHRSSRRAALADDDDDDMANYQTFRNGSSRRGQTSITHLMNYSTPTRTYLEAAYPSHHNPRSSYRRNPTWGLGSGYHQADKARYVNANYRFVVTPGGDYTKQATDPNEHLDWNNVLQVIASAESQKASCPICLDEPVAPRMAKCGHIFCLTCLIRYMNSISEEEVRKPGFVEKRVKWKKCPICEDGIYMSDVRPVRMYAAQESRLPQPGDDVILRLMGRFTNSTLALPRSGGTEDLARDEVPWHFAANVLDYARIMKGTSGYMNEEYDREIAELGVQESQDELLYEENEGWEKRAVDTIKSAKEKLQDLSEQNAALAEAVRDAQKRQFRSTEPDFFFYLSPPHLYLSPLDIRILRTKYGTFSQFPSTLLPRLEHISTGHVVDDALRKRAKYLGHLPDGCIVSFIECDWTDIISPEILATFQEEIDRRRKRNREKEAQDDRERAEAERIESESYRRLPTKKTFSAAIDNVEGGGWTIGRATSTLNDADFHPLSGTTPPNPRQGFSQLASMSTSPSTSRTVWGTPVAQATTPDFPPVPEEAVDDGWLRDDEFLQSLDEDASIAMQMEAMGIDMSAQKNKGPALSEPAVATGKKGKKQKKTKITLMSTGGKRMG